MSGVAHKKELWLFTTRFPHGFREAFLENELPVLCDRFEKVVIFPEHADGELRPIPANAEVRHPIADPFKGAGPAMMLRNARVVVKLLRSLMKGAPSWEQLREQWPYLRARVSQFVHRAEVIRRELMPRYDPERVIVYAYWTHDWATVLGVVRERERRLRYFSRAHGFDIYEQQNRNGWIPFRSFQLEHVERVYCASRTGMEHLRSRHPDIAERFTLARLGTTDHGPGPHDPSGPLKLVSCSFLIPRKRVLLLIEALKRVTVPVRWVHFGSGEEEQRVKEAAQDLPPNVKVTFMGMFQNADIMKWYRAHPVDAFVHLAELEGGVAVAAQEAASFGIPLIVADSGGVRDLVDARTGVLLPQDPAPDEVASLLNNFQAGPMATATFRAGVRQTWSEGFEARRVFHAFVDQVLLAHEQGTFAME
ncbi:MAG: glycosyltransferase [Flavobacteriales bacterium]|nr:glycosyltransferase [Flavobacteriales bacterium]HPF90835.1 glycosyltransferase [Flavobacteriales bacterium]